MYYKYVAVSISGNLSSSTGSVSTVRWQSKVWILVWGTRFAKKILLAIVVQRKKTKQLNHSHSELISPVWIKHHKRSKWTYRTDTCTCMHYRTSFLWLTQDYTKPPANNTECLIISSSLNYLTVIIFSLATVVLRTEFDTSV